MNTLAKVVKFVSSGGGALKLGAEIFELTVPGALGKLAKRGALAADVLPKLKAAVGTIMEDSDLVDDGIESVAEVIARGPVEVDEVAENAAAWALSKSAEIVADAGGGNPGANALAVVVVDAAESIVKREGTTLTKVVGEMDDLVDAGWTGSGFQSFIKSANKDAQWFKLLGKILAMAGAAGATLYVLGDELLDEDEDDEEGGSAGPITSPGKEDDMPQNNDDNALAQGDIIASAQVIQQVRSVLRSMNVSSSTLISLLNIMSMPRTQLLEALTVIQSTQK
jgi:hypothetical protein